jgi:isopentenyl-diphosphate delta-isomerase
LDLVDEGDNVIGEVMKKEANNNPSLWHREIRVILYDTKGRVLLQQRSFKKKVYPGAWAETCAGHVPAGKTYEETAYQELREELGFDTELKLAEKTLVRMPNETHFAAWFIGRYQGEKIVVAKDEIEQIKFLGKEEYKDFIKQVGMMEISDKMINQYWP